MNKLLIICGPTASGKSYLATEMAQMKDGVIINADSMQLYEDLPIITASPSLKVQKIIPHKLYNYLSATSNFTVGDYLKTVVEVIKEASAAKQLPILVGGSGMYINALLNGISMIPAIDHKYREEAKEIVFQHGIESLFHELSMLDNIASSKLKSTDTQRIIRAYEVIRQTGNSIFYYQNLPQLSPLIEHDIELIYLLPERKFLYETCNKRFIELIDNGGIEEVRKFYYKYPNLSTGPSKALGVPEVISYLKEKITIEKAIELAQTKTRQYAKRQITWFNNQLKIEHKIIQYSNVQNFMEKI